MQKYKPWGETRQLIGELPTDRTFQGQRNPGWGLMHFGARWFDSALGRFAQADTVVPGAGNPLAWDRYAGLGNNPIKYVDPSGHKACDGDFESSDDCWVYVPENTKPYFHRLPISQEELKGVQWFGASQRSYDLWANGDGIYAYCQGMHCGLDLLAPYGTQVYAGVYGTVISVYSIANGKLSDFEGPYKILIETGDGYVITYGHTDGTAFVKRGDPVTPGTAISGVGNMGGAEGSGQIDHIHLEVRGPGGWYGGPSHNPVNHMSKKDVAVLVDVAKKQEIQIEMSKFGSSGMEYPPPAEYMPRSIHRTPAINFWR